jgi:hypothetical protein
MARRKKKRSSSLGLITFDKLPAGEKFRFSGSDHSLTKVDPDTFRGPFGVRVAGPAIKAQPVTLVPMSGGLGRLLLDIEDKVGSPLLGVLVGAGIAWAIVKALKA